MSCKVHPIRKGIKPGPTVQSRVRPAYGWRLHRGRRGEREAVVGVGARASRAHHGAERLVVQTVLAHVWKLE